MLATVLEIVASNGLNLRDEWTSRLFSSLPSQSANPTNPDERKVVKKLSNQGGVQGIKTQGYPPHQPSRTHPLAHNKETLSHDEPGKLGYRARYGAGQPAARAAHAPQLVEVHREGPRDPRRGSRHHPDQRSHRGGTAGPDQREQPAAARREPHEQLRGGCRRVHRQPR